MKMKLLTLIILLTTLSCSTTKISVYSVTQHGIMIVDEPMNLSTFENRINNDPPETFYEINISPYVRYYEVDAVIKILKKNSKRFKTKLAFIKPGHKIKNRFDVPIDELPSLLEQPPQIEN